MRDRGRGTRDGYTLVEVIVALVLLGLILGVSGVAVASLRAPRESQWLRALYEARSQAIRNGKPVRAVLDHSPPMSFRVPAPLFLPDGSALGAGVERLTGMPHGRP